MKFVYGLVLMFMANAVYAESLSLSLPAGTGSYQSDKFRDGDLDCSNTIGSATNLEFGVTGIIDKTPNAVTKKRDVDVGVYARIIIPLGKRVKQRVDCNRLFEIALREKLLEVQRLELELKRLQELTFEE